jgi:tRNA threonylcarbamoyladenosine biosynthesis protein TsaB
MISDMIVLAADTSTPVISVSVTRDDELVAETVVHCGRKHSERLLDTVAWVLNEAGLTLEAVDLLAVSAGPGSFTGLRIGVAAWKGLALGRRLPLVGVPTLDAMSRLPGMRDGVLCVLLDAKMHEVFGAAYEFRAGERVKVMEDRVGPVEAVIEELEGPALFLGDGALLYREAIERRWPESTFAPAWASVPRASAVAAEARHRLRLGAGTDPGAVNPVYLRKSQPEEARKAVSP